jgi:O-methyltransferase
VKRAILGGFWMFGRRLDRRYPRDIQPHVIEFMERVAPYSGAGGLRQMSVERFSTLCDGVDYLVEHHIPGSIVECGVFRGASMMAIALELRRIGESERDLYLFDTFTGMPEPSERDISVHGSRAVERWRSLRTGADASTWNLASLEEVRSNMLSTGYEERRLHFIRGRVEDTIPASAPEQIALLRLDTDWYESTRHELIHLFPRLSVGGLLIIDDYGHWAGSRAASDEYFNQNGIRILLHRVDYSARMAVKQSEIPTQQSRT